MGKLKTKNPCTDVCKYDQEKVCKGCGRTRIEVKEWKSFPDEKKDAINRRVRETHGKGEGRKKK